MSVLQVAKLVAYKCQKVMVNQVKVDKMLWNYAQSSTS